MSRHANGKRDPETDATLRALRRAARRAQELGARTGTPVYVIEGHRIIDLTKQSLVVSGEPVKPRALRQSK